MLALMSTSNVFGEVVLDDVGSAEADGDFFQVQVGWVVFCWETTP